MLFKNLFKKKEPQLHYNPTSISLSDLRTGWVFEYDMKTWQVVEHYEYDWGNEFFTDEFQVTSGEETAYLHLEHDDELEASLSMPLEITQLDATLPQHMQEHDEPPATLHYRGEVFHRTEEGQAEFHKVGSDNWERLVSWHFQGPEINGHPAFITIERWQEESFEAAIGFEIPTYKFTNLLPAD